MRPLRRHISHQSLTGLRNFDELLSKLDGAGRYQLIVLLAMMLCLAAAGAAAVTQALPDSAGNYTCLIGHSLHENASGLVVEDSSSCWDEASSDQCFVTRHCQPTEQASWPTASSATTAAAAAAATAAAATARLPCLRWTFNEASGLWRHGVVSKFGLVCQLAKLTTLPPVLFKLGVSLGSCPYGLLADLRSRQFSLAAALLNLSAAALAAALAERFWLYSVAQLLSGLGVGGVLVCAFVSVVEATDAKNRHYWAFSSRLGISAGALLTLGLAASLRNHSHLLLAIAVSCVFFNAPLAFIGRSPRWLAASGFGQKATNSVRRLARVNHMSLPRNFSAQTLIWQSSKPALIQRLKQRPLAKAGALLAVTWLAAAVPFHGVAWLAQVMPDLAKFHSTLLWLWPDVIACALGLVAGRLIGRRTLLMVAFTLGLVLTLAGALVRLWPDSVPAAAAAGAALAAKIFLALALDSVWLISCELSPTWIRASATSIGCCISSICGLCATLLLPDGPEGWLKPAPFFLFSIFCAGGLFVACFLSETKGCALVDWPVSEAQSDDLLVTVSTEDVFCESDS